MMWGTLGNNMEAYQKNVALFEQLLDSLRDGDALLLLDLLRPKRQEANVP